MGSLLESIFQVSGVILLICAAYYYSHFKNTKRGGTLTPSELTMIIITKLALFLCGGSYLLLLLDKS